MSSAQTDRYARLRECVEKATPGEWCWYNFHDLKGDGGGACVVSIASISETNRAYIAAASPATIHDLLQERDRLREAVYGVRRVIVGEHAPSWLSQQGLAEGRQKITDICDTALAAISAGEEGK